jgi:hypothetical protein
MKKIITVFLISSIFVAIGSKAKAQKLDSLKSNYKLLVDSGKAVYNVYYVPDSLHSETPIIRKTKKLTPAKTLDTAGVKGLKTSKVTYKTATGFRIVTDSIYKGNKAFSLKADSFRRTTTTVAVNIDTARRKKSLFTLQAMDLKNDSIHAALYKKKIAESKKLYQVQIAYDSLQFQKYLQHKKNVTFHMTYDSVYIKSGYRVKKLYISLPCTETDTVFIKNNYRKIQVLTNSSPNVGVSTKLAYRDSIKVTDETLMNKIGVTLNRSGKNITVMVNGANPKKMPDNDEFKEILQNEMNLKSTIHIMVPSNVVVVINTTNAEANVEHYVKTFKTEITNGTLVLKNADDATIKGTYSTIKAGSIKNADVVMQASNMDAVNINSLKITSSSSTVKLKECVSLDVVQSSGDGFTVEKVGSITGTKSFGKLTVVNLDGKMSLSGTSSSIAVNNFSNTNPQVAITGKYSDVKLPLSKLPDYAVYYEGSFNDVNRTNTVTQQLNSLGKLSATLTVQKDSLSLDSKNQHIAKTILKANAGNTKGEHTKIDIVCPYCNVVFY